MKPRSLFATLAPLVTIVAVIGLYKSTARPSPVATPWDDSTGADQDPIGDARDADARVALAVLKSCAPGKPTMKCSVARGLVVAQIISDFETVTEMYDPRVLDEAYVALAGGSVPLQEAAIGYLARVALPDSKLRAKAVLAIVNALAATRSLAVGAQAARALAGSPMRDVGQRWIDHHKHFPTDDQTPEFYLPMPIPDVRSLGFTRYANAIPYAVADTDRSIGYVTHDSFEQVVAFFTKQTGSPPTKPDQWMQFAVSAIQKETTAAGMMASQPTPADLKEIQRLSVEYSRTKDPALMQQVQAIMARKPPMPPVGHRVPNGQVTGVYVSHMDDKPTAFVVKSAPDHVALMVFVYPEPSLQATVIEYAWSLVDADPLAPTAPVGR
jgi:hypothetical protein